jgi:hypothetical protein
MKYVCIVHTNYYYLCPPFPLPRIQPLRSSHCMTHQLASSHLYIGGIAQLEHRLWRPTDEQTIRPAATITTFSLFFFFIQGEKRNKSRIG